MEKYYYLRDKANRPVVTVCLVGDETGYARGVAICSPKDMPRKKTGRRIARQRAMYALNNKTEDRNIRRIEAWNVLAEADRWCKILPMYPQKIQYDPVLNEMEKRLVSKPKNAMPGVQ